MPSRQTSDCAARGSENVACTLGAAPSSDPESVDAIVHRATGHLSMAAGVMVFGYAAVDSFVVAPEHRFFYFLMRASFAALFLVHAFIVSRTRATAYSYLHGYFSYALYISLFCVAVIRVGVYPSPYYGAPMLMIGSLAVMPWHPRHAWVICVSIMAIWLVLNFHNGVEPALAVHAKYMAGLSWVAVYACHIRHRDICALHASSMQLAAALRRERIAGARAHAVAQATQMLAHDVRKPFTLLRILLDLLGDAKTMDDMTSTISEVRGEILTASAAVDEMIQDVMEMGARSPPVTAPVEATELIATVLRNFFFRPTRAYDIKLRYELNHQLKLQVHQAKIERVLLNIVGNALEAMNGRGELWFKTRTLRHEGQAFIEMTLGNSNSFIPEQNIKQLFDPFFTSGKKGGTGLGLAIVHKIIESHGGSIECYSKQDVGVEFIFTLPASSAPAAIAALPASAEEVRSTGTGVDDVRPQRSAMSSRPNGPILAGANVPAVVLIEDSLTHQAAWRALIPGEALAVFTTPEECLRASEADPRLLSRARCIVVDQQFPHGSMLGTEFIARMRPRTQARFLLCSDQKVQPVPIIVDGVLEKRAYRLDELLAQPAPTPLEMESLPHQSSIVAAAFWPVS